MKNHRRESPALKNNLSLKTREKKPEVRVKIDIIMVGIANNWQTSANSLKRTRNDKYFTIE